jgi:hypothetical protein
LYLADTHYIVDPGNTKDTCCTPAFFPPKIIIVSSLDNHHWGGSTFAKARWGGIGGICLYFPVWTLDKLLAAREALDPSLFSDKAGGIVLKICNDLHVRKESQMYWCELNRKHILAALNRKRNDVTAYLKKRFCGKSFG